MSKPLDVAYTLLSGWTELVDLVGGSSNPRIWPNIAPQGALEPYVVPSMISRVGERNMAGPSSLAVAFVQVDVFATDPEDLEAVSKSVRTAMDGYRGVIAGLKVSSIVLQDEQFTTDEREPGSGETTERNRMTFAIHHHRE